MEWYYEREGTQEGPVSEGQLIAHVTRGFLTGESLVWKEGMPDWVPFSETDLSREKWVTCAVSGEVRPEADMLQYGEQFCLPEHKEQFVQTLMEGGEEIPEISQGFYRYKDPGERATWAVRTILISAGAFAIFTITQGIQFYYLFEGRTEEMLTVSLIVGGVSLFYLASFIVGVVFFCRWFFLAAENGHALDPPIVRFSPNWCVGYFFIPIMNLFRPYQAMKDIWYASLPEGAPRTNRSGPPLVIAWWTMWIISGALGNASGAGEELISIVIISGLNCVAMVAAAFLIVRLIQTITANQLKKAAQYQ